MRRSLLLLNLLLLTGCIIVPTGEIRQSKYSRRPIDNSSINALQPGVATRIDVLLSLGAPEAALEEDRYFLYRWDTQSGFLFVNDTDSFLVEHFHDLLFEFDPSGRLVRSGDLKTLLEEGLGADRPPDPGCPARIPIHLPVSWWHLVPPRSSDPDGYIIFDENRLRVEWTIEEEEDLIIPTGAALVFDYENSRSFDLEGNWRRFDMKFQDSSGKVRIETVLVEVTSLIDLARHLHRHSPGIEFRD